MKLIGNLVVFVLVGSFIGAKCGQDLVVWLMGEDPETVRVFGMLGHNLLGGVIDRGFVVGAIVGAFLGGVFGYCHSVKDKVHTE